MAAAILHSIKQGAYIAISLYVVFIAVVTATSMNPQLRALGSVSPAPAWVERQSSVPTLQERAS